MIRKAITGLLTAAGVVITPVTFGSVVAALPERTTNIALLTIAFSLFLLLLLLGLLIALWFLRSRKAKPVSPPAQSETGGSYLEVADAPDGSRFNLSPEGITIGRGPENDLVIREDFSQWMTVSHRHARIYREGDRWIVEDENSTNGIYVNGRRTGRNLLRDGWQLSIGGVVFTFRTTTEEA